jgi:hypothetical protein
MEVPENFFLSKTALRGITYFLLLGTACLIVIFLLSPNQFLSFICAIGAVLFGFLSLKNFKLLDDSNTPVISIQDEKIVFNGVLHEEIPFNCIQSVRLISPSSRQLGYTLYFELKPKIDNGQRYWPTKSLPLFLIHANREHLLQLIQNRVAAANVP